LRNGITVRKLTLNQIEAIQNLIINPLIDSTEVEFSKNGLSRITIKSAVNAPWDGPKGVDMMISLALDVNFPGLEYLCTPAKYTNPADGLEHELYFINYEGETLINLIMRSDSEQKEGTPIAVGVPVEKEVSHGYITIKIDETELPGPCESLV